jgi:transposase
VTQVARERITNQRECDSLAVVNTDGDRSVPDDLEALRAFALTTAAELDQVVAERDRLLGVVERLEHLVREFQRARFGKKSEKLDADQLKLGLEDLELAIAESVAEEEKKSSAPVRTSHRRQGNRGHLPQHLPHLHVTIAPEKTICPCCNGQMHVIGEETSQRLDVIPAKYQVIVTHRPKYACRACEGTVVQAPAPAHLIEGGIPSEAMVAHVLTAKYGWHLPLYRQSQMLKAQGLDIDRSTLAYWVGTAAAELKPVYRRLVEKVLEAGKLAVDETPVKVLDPGRGQTKTGYFWTMARDDRPWGGSAAPQVVYRYAPSRAGFNAKELLADYCGIVQCDGYAVYKRLNQNRITLAFCWAHLRRKFFDIADKGPAPIAEEALRRIAELYAIDKTIRGSPPDERVAVRRERSLPLIAALKAWLQARLSEVSGKSLIAEAIRYALSHWDGLTRFLDDGRIELDTNIVERSMRPVALNRKNALFAGHDEGAANWALIASLIETCKLNDVDPEAWLADVLTKLVNLWPQARLDELMPWAWAAAHKSEPRAAA